MLRITHTRGRKAPSVEDFVRCPVKVGASAASDLVFYGESAVAEAHAEIRLEGGAFFLVDLGSAAGTFIGQTRVERHPLRSGDEVSLGAQSGPAFRIEVVAQRMAAADDGRVDLQTAERLVRDALTRSSAHDAKAAAIVDKKVKAATRGGARRNFFLGLGVALALLGALFTALLIWRGQQNQSELVRSAGLDDPGKVTTPASGDVPDRVMNGRQIYEDNKAALYVLGYTQGNKIGAFCTAFAISPTLLATNAHCVLAAREKGAVSLIATQNDSGGKVKFRILSTSYHPKYRSKTVAADSPDVGLVRISGNMPKVVTIASDAELRAIGAGDDAFVLGFPGRVMDPISPSATFLQGHVNRVTGLDGGATTPDRSVIVQHDAVTRGGNSGSPIFNQYGHVIALHAAHIDEEDEQQVNGQRTKVLDSSPYRIGMRVDLLQGVPKP